MRFKSKRRSTRGRKKSRKINTYRMSRGGVRL